MAVNAGFDSSRLDELSKDLLVLAQKQFPEKTKVFLRKEAKLARTRAKRVIRETVNKKTGNLLKGVTAGKVWKNGDAYQVRVYNEAKHAHLIEDGHVVWSHGEETEYFSPGKHVMERAGYQTDEAFAEGVDEFVDDLLKKGLG